LIPFAIPLISTTLFKGEAIQFANMARSMANTQSGTAEST